MVGLWVRMIHPHLPERVMCQFRFQQSILRDPSVFAPPTMVYRDVDVVFNDFYNHLVPHEAQSVLTPSTWSGTFDYIQ